MPDVTWPSDGSISVQDWNEDLLRLKAALYPQHTATDQRDAYNLLILFAAAMKGHTVGRLNQVLRRLDPATCDSRPALIALLSMTGQQLRPMQPARGLLMAQLRSVPTAGDVLVKENQKFVVTGSVDPSYTTDGEITAEDPTSFAITKVTPLGVETALTFGASFSLAQDDRLVFSRPQYTTVTTKFATTTVGTPSVCLEHTNNTEGTPTSVSIIDPSTIDLFLDDYLRASQIPSTGALVGISVRVTHPSSGGSTTGTVVLDGGSPKVRVSAMGQLTPSQAAGDYRVLCDWLPVPVTAQPVLTGASVTMSVGLSSVFTVDGTWYDHPTFGYGLSLRAFAGGTSTVTIGANSEDEFRLAVPVTQGSRVTRSIGTASGTPLERFPVPTVLLEDPVVAPQFEISFGSEVWTVVDDFSASGSTSRHVVVREHPTDGWCVFTGTGGVAAIPTNGLSVNFGYRTDSLVDGNIAAGTALSAPNASTLRSVALYQGMTGYVPAEASDEVSLAEFRTTQLQRASLTNESAVTEPQIIAALTGGTVGRATFETRDGRRPFSRAEIDREGAGVFKTYRVVLVSAATADGIPLADDLVDATRWLNGYSAGIEVVRGRGPINSIAAATSYTPKRLRPSVTITSIGAKNVRAAVDAILRRYLSPNAVEDDETFVWSFGGTVPVAVIFARLWDGLRNIIDRKSANPLTITLTDGVTTWQQGDAVPLDPLEFELPAMSTLYNADTDITVLA